MELDEVRSWDVVPCPQRHVQQIHSAKLYVSEEVVWAKESLAGNGGICSVPGSHSDMGVFCG